jgi:hypothetical protein
LYTLIYNSINFNLSYLFKIEFRICPKTLSKNLFLYFEFETHTVFINIIIIIGSYNGDDSLNISLYKLYRNPANSKLYIPNNYSFYDYENNNKRKFTKS